MDTLAGEWLRAAGGARADRGVRRGAGAGPRAGDRHLPLRLDAGLRAVALDARQAGRARGRGDRRCRSLQRAVLLVLPAVLRRGQPGRCPSPRSSPLAAGLFDLRGVAFAAWTLAAFAIGGLAGMLIRRVVPAIVATLAAYAGLALAAALYLRQHYLTPLVTSKPERARLRVDHQPAVAHQERPAGQPVRAQPGPPGGRPRAGRERRRPGCPRRVAVPRPARLHAADQLPARPAGSGHSSGSRAAGCSRSPSSSSQRPSGSSAAEPPERPATDSPTDAKSEALCTYTPREKHIASRALARAGSATSPAPRHSCGAAWSLAVSTALAGCGGGPSTPAVATRSTTTTAQPLGRRQHAGNGARGLRLLYALKRRAELPRPHRRRRDPEASRCQRVPGGQQRPGPGGPKLLRGPAPRRRLAERSGRPAGHRPRPAGLPQGRRLHAPARRSPTSPTRGFRTTASRSTSRRASTRTLPASRVRSDLHKLIPAGLPGSGSSSP